MMKRRWGRIINISSVVGRWATRARRTTPPRRPGVIGFTKSVARELASRNVLVNAIAPGFIETDMTDGAVRGEREDLRKPDSARATRPGPADIARAVLFLASDLADYITGQVLVVDGGMVM